MKFTTPIKELKPRGYTFQKLYASEYITYRKEFGEHNDYQILLWKKDSQLEIDDWFGSTENIINCYKDNLEQWKIDNAKLPRPRSCMTLNLNRKTGVATLRDMKEYYGMIMSDDAKIQEKWYDTYREVVLHIELFDEVIKEVEYLTK